MTAIEIQQKTDYGSQNKYLFLRLQSALNARGLYLNSIHKGKKAAFIRDNLKYDILDDELKSILEELLVINRGLIIAICTKYYGKGLLPSELYSIARSVFIKTVWYYDLDRGTQFSTFFDHALRDRLKVEVAKAQLVDNTEDVFSDCIPEEEEPEEYLARFGDSGKIRTIEEHILDQNLVTYLMNSSDLTDDEIEAVQQLYGLRNQISWQQCEVAQNMGVSHTQVYLLHKRAIKKMKHRLAMET